MANINTTAKKRHYLRYNGSQSEWELIHFYTEWGAIIDHPSFAEVATSGNFSDLGTTPTTLAGYGITDAHINNGVITLGSNTITPLTAHEYRQIKIDDSSFIAKSSDTALNLKGGTSITLTTGTNGAVTISSSALTAHEYRPVSVNGTSLLAKSADTALNLKAGTGISLTGSGGDVTITSTVEAVQGSNKKEWGALFTYGTKQVESSTPQKLWVRLCDIRLRPDGTNKHYSTSGLLRIEIPGINAYYTEEQNHLIASDANSKQGFFGTFLIDSNVIPAGPDYSSTITALSTSKNNRAVFELRAITYIDSNSKYWCSIDINGYFTGSQQFVGSTDVGAYCAYLPLEKGDYSVLDTESVFYEHQVGSQYTPNTFTQELPATGLDIDTIEIIEDGSIITNQKIRAGQFFENGTALSSKYAGISHSHNNYLPLSGERAMTGLLTAASNGIKMTAISGSPDNTAGVLNYSSSSSRLYFGTNGSTAGVKTIAYTEDLPVTKIIPGQTTANKILLSTTTNGTAKWSDFSNAGFLKTNSSGVVSVDTNTYAGSSTAGGPATSVAHGFQLWVSEAQQATSYFDGSDDVALIIGEGLSLSGGAGGYNLTSAYKTGFTTDGANRNYAVAVDSNGKMYVNVPWEDHTYTVNNGTLSITVGGNSAQTFTANQSGNTSITIDAASLGLSGALRYRGVSAASITDGSTTNTVTIDGPNSETITATAGDVVLYSGKEFLWNGSSWEELGDESSHALKSVTITGTGVLGGGGSLEQNRTITHNEVLGSAKSSGLYKVTLDKYGHVSAATAVVKSDITGLGIPESDTWRPLGTGATDAAAGNHNHDTVYVKNAGVNPKLNNGTEITQPAGENAFSIKTNGTTADTGILWISDDSAYICNSGDSGYVFGVFDKDVTQDFSSADNAALAVLQSSAGVKMKGALTIGGSGTNGATSVLSVNYGPITNTNYGNTVSIGSLNSGFCHFQNSANIPFYFNKSIQVDGSIGIYNTSYGIASTGITTVQKVNVAPSGTTKATMQYNTTDDCIEFVFA